MKTVRALELGFYNGAMRHPGTVFEVPDGFKGKWFTVVDAEHPAPEAEVPEPQKPIAPSEFTKAQPVSFVQQMNKKKI